jgi:hypothetical protein
VLLLSVASFGIYPAYWLYRNLKQVAVQRGASISPFWRTFIAFVPVLGWPVFKDQLEWFAESATTAGARSEIRPWPHTLGFQLVSTAVWVLPMPWALAGNAAAVFLLPAQRTLNAYWAVEQPDVPMREEYTAGEIAFALVCAVLWVLVLAALFIGEGVVAA